MFKNICLTTIVAMGAMWPALAWSLAYPTRPIRIIAQFTPGTSTDIMARVTAQHLSKVFNRDFPLALISNGSH